MAQTRKGKDWNGDSGNDLVGKMDINDDVEDECATTGEFIVDTSSLDFYGGKDFKDCMYALRKLRNLAL